MRYGFAFLILLIALYALPSTDAHAQQSLLERPQSGQKKKQEKEYRKPVPRIFSSEFANIEEAERLDILYDSLLETLWRYAASDFNLQKKLNTLIEPQTFGQTRAHVEFTPTLKSAMANLNNNYKNTQSDIESAQKRFADIKLGIRKTEHDALDAMWNDQIKSLGDFADKHFKSQHKFLQINI